MLQLPVQQTLQRQPTQRIQQPQQQTVHQQKPTVRECKFFDESSHKFRRRRRCNYRRSMRDRATLPG